MDDKDLIRQAQQGDHEAVALLFQQHYAFLHKYLVKITMQPHLAEDLAQETMIRCMEKLHTYNYTSRFSSWMITIASRLYLDSLRRRKREQAWMEQEERSQSPRQLRWQAQRAGEDWPRVLDALSGLNADTRLPVIMKHYYGYSQEEIADMLGIALGTVKSRIHHGLKQLRKELSHEEA